MQYNKLGNSDIKVSSVALGTWAIGGGSWWGASDERNSILAIHTSLDKGVNLIDTAPAYGFGYSENVIGKAIEGRRSQVILSTKCGLWWQDPSPNFSFELDGVKVYKSLKPETIRKELEMSLKRLKTDYIDIYHIHWPDEMTPIKETAQCLNELVKEGKIRTIAVSNVSIEQCEEYFLYCNLVAVQMKYSMLDRKNVEQFVNYCKINNISILAYSPLEQGLLTGKIGMDKVLSEEEYRNSIPWYRPENRVRVLEMLQTFEPLTQKYNCTLGQLVIAWTAATNGITSCLCGARTQSHAQENVAAGNLKIESEDIAYIKNKVENLGEAK